MTHAPKVVVMGGGTGTFPVVAALRQLPDQQVEVASVIAVSDSGGSTGRIRDEFGFQPVGDLRQALAALAPGNGEAWIRRILLYRFDKGTGLKGHNLGNLILTALQDMTGNTTEALEIAEKIFRLQGKVIPATEDNVNLQIEYEDGSKVVGEHTLDADVAAIPDPDHPKKIRQVRLIPHAQVNPAAVKALQVAQLIVIGPGDYYASLLATLSPEGMSKAFAQTKAKVVYIVNLMTRLTQTNGMTAADHVEGIEKAIGRSIDTIILNNEEIPADVCAAYAKEHEFPVQDDLKNDQRVVRAPLLSQEIYQTKANDMAHRSLLRHDQQKLATVLARVLTK